MLCVSGQAVTIHFCVDMEIKMRPKRREITVGGGVGVGLRQLFDTIVCL